MENGVIETRVTRIWLGEDGILREEFTHGAEVTLDDMMSIDQVQGSFAQKGKVFVLADVSFVKSATKEARDFAASEAMARTTGALALLIDSPVSKVLVNFFIRLNKPLFPTKLFISEGEAIKWLTVFIK